MVIIITMHAGLMSSFLGAVFALGQPIDDHDHDSDASSTNL